MKQTKHTLSNHGSLLSNIYIQIQHINSKHNFNIPQPPLNSQDLPQWLQQTKIAWRTLYNARNLENSQHLRHHINSAINTRCEKILTQPTKIINSILNRHTDSVYFDNIKTEDNIITNPSCIKQHIQSHFCQWTAHQSHNQTIFENEWETEYSPSSIILSSWYNTALTEISIDEVINTINQFSNNKACGPSGISYEMLKHCGIQTITAITALLNRCITLQQIPKQ